MQTRETTQQEQQTDDSRIDQNLIHENNSNLQLIVDKEHILQLLGQIMSLDSKLHELKASSTATTVTTIEQLETELNDISCAIWDMSASTELAKLLTEECMCCDVCFNIIYSNHDDQCFPRLLEIMYGILANLASSEQNIAKQFSQNDKFVNYMFRDLIICFSEQQQQQQESEQLQDESYLDVMCEIIRLITACTSYGESDKSWLTIVRSREMKGDDTSTPFLSFLIFIIDSSLSVKLLRNCSTLLLNCFYFDPICAQILLFQEDAIHVIIRCIHDTLNNHDGDEHIIDCMLRVLECVTSVSTSDPNTLVQLLFHERVEIEKRDQSVVQLTVLDTCEELLTRYSMDHELSLELVDSVFILLDIISGVDVNLFQAFIRNLLNKSTLFTATVVNRLLSSSTNQSEENDDEELIQILFKSLQTWIIGNLNQITNSEMRQQNSKLIESRSNELKNLSQVNNMTIQLPFS